jgi:hypothetical protein
MDLEIAVMRSIACAGFDYQSTKRLCAGAGWQLVEDEPLEFLQYAQFSDQLEVILGPPSRTGSYYYHHRRECPYSFSWWGLKDASLALVQDEHDIQFGMDVSLWVLPEGIEVRLPILNEN